MDKDNIFRLALMCSESQAKTFITNLKKLVKIVLHDNYGKELNAPQITSEIKERFDIEFTTEEILAAINKDKSQSIVVVKESKFKDQTTFSLTAEEYQKPIYDSNKTIDIYVERFIKENAEYSELDKEKICDLMNKYFFSTFNNDVQTVLLLLKKDYEKIEMNSTEYNIEEAEIINSFLNWNDADKNKFVMEIISACFDYCMLTVKKDSSSYKDIFNKKVFYFDANVIFRLAGFNKTERQNTIQLFIKKCIDSGIELRYTNFTYNEIKNTIHDRVIKIEKIVKGNEPIRSSSVKLMLPKYSNMDLYDLYLTWTHDKSNRYGDYAAFEKYLIKKVEKCLEPFKYCNVNSYKAVKSKKDSFEDLFDSYKDFKENRYKFSSDPTIEVDVNNYMYIKEKNSPITANSFLEIQNYFITADYCLTDWAVEMNPGTIPFFVLPSVWYSILLKYKGRNSNDYYAFTQFLNVRIPEKFDEEDELKSEILAIVMDLHDSREVKEKIIDKINDELSNRDVEILDPVEYVEKKHTEITQQKVADAVKKERTIADEKMSEAVESVRQEATKALNEEKNNSKERVKEAYDDGKLEGLNEGVNLGKNDVIDSLVNNRVRRNRIWQVVLTILAIVFILIIVVIIIVSIFKNKAGNSFLTSIESNSVLASVVLGLVETAILLLKGLGEKFNFLSTDEEKVRKAINKKIR